MKIYYLILACFSLQGCRFIASRTAMDFEIANYMVAKENLHDEQPVLNVSHFLST